VFFSQTKEGAMDTTIVGYVVKQEETVIFKKKVFKLTIEFPQEHKMLDFYSQCLLETPSGKTNNFLILIKELDLDNSIGKTSLIIKEAQTLSSEVYSHYKNGEKTEIR